MSVYVTDSHPLVWYAAGHHTKLSKKALRVFNAASRHQALIYVPAVVFWEIALLSKLGRIILREPFSQWAALLLAKGGFEIIPLDPEAIACAVTLTFNDDPFDAVIVASAMTRDLPLITKDTAVVDANIVDILW